MKKLLTKEELIAFEDDIAQCFNNKMIKAPIHLEWDNEEALLQIFENINNDDWVICTWRSHYKCLLKGMPKDKIKQDILDGRSIEMCNKEYKIFSSAIVAGNISIALGIALDIKRNNKTNKVYCFVGDMGSCSGQFHEAHQYAKNFDLPIIFVIENNGLSVCTDTMKCWNYNKHPYEPEFYDAQEQLVDKCGKIWYYKYDLHFKYPHAGSGIRIQF